jgi:hypothetical protein
MVWYCTVRYSVVVIVDVVIIIIIIIIISLTARRKVFESKRKAHYNEYYAVKLARKLMNAEEASEPTKEGNSSGRTSPEVVFCGVEGCLGHRCGRAETCESVREKTGGENEVMDKDK